MFQPPKSTILALQARWVSKSGVRSKAVVSDMREKVSFRVALGKQELRMKAVEHRQTEASGA